MPPLLPTHLFLLELKEANPIDDEVECWVVVDLPCGWDGINRGQGVPCTRHSSIDPEHLSLFLQHVFIHLRCKHSDQLNNMPKTVTAPELGLSSIKYLLPLVHFCVKNWWTNGFVKHHWPPSPPPLQMTTKKLCLFCLECELVWPSGKASGW